MPRSAAHDKEMVYCVPQILAHSKPFLCRVPQVLAHGKATLCRVPQILAHGKPGHRHLFAWPFRHTTHTRTTHARAAPPRPPGAAPGGGQCLAFLEQLTERAQACRAAFSPASSARRDLAARGKLRAVGGRLQASSSRFVRAKFQQPH